MPKRGISRFSIENLLSHNTKKLRRGTFLYFTKFVVSKRLMDKTGGGGVVSRFSVKIFFLSAEEFRRGTLQLVTNFGHRKTLCFRELFHDFLSKFYLSHSAEKFRSGTLLIRVSENVR